ncbi:hypothetical protein bthur0003_64110 [Bacillus thuringiensis serovar thuringiensis str. T01001]|nr:hypothetical protein bthur0003_64110 [Bacillus thuringiensis serovar thuringiensis str. T01001]
MNIDYLRNPYNFLESFTLFASYFLLTYYFSYFKPNCLEQ